jgi:hypothetical protein
VAYFEQISDMLNNWHENLVLCGRRLSTLPSCDRYNVMFSHVAIDACVQRYGYGPPSPTCIKEFWKNSNVEDKKFRAASETCARGLDLGEKVLGLAEVHCKLDGATREAESANAAKLSSSNHVLAYPPDYVWVDACLTTAI